MDSPTREAGLTPVFDKDTTASGKYSTRRSLTVWDLQAEKERQCRRRQRQTISPFSEHSFRRSASASDRLFVLPMQGPPALTREYSSRSAAARPQQTTIPPWNVNHLPLSRSSSIVRSNSIVVNSPSGRSVHALRSGVYAPSPSPSNASSYNYPNSPDDSRFSKSNAGVNSACLRPSKSLSTFSDMSPGSGRYGDRAASPTLYPARRAR